MENFKILSKFWESWTILKNSSQKVKIERLLVHNSIFYESRKKFKTLCMRKEHQMINEIQAIGKHKILHWFKILSGSLQHP